MSRFLTDRAEEIAQAMGGTRRHQPQRHVPEHYSIVPYQTTHNTGGAIMGADPKTAWSTVPAVAGRSPNLFVQGACVFPQNAGYNPTDTVGALAYWSVRRSSIATASSRGRWCRHEAHPSGSRACRLALLAAGLSCRSRVDRGRCRARDPAARPAMAQARSGPAESCQRSTGRRHRSASRHRGTPRWWSRPARRLRRHPRRPGRRLLQLPRHAGRGRRHGRLSAVGRVSRRSTCSSSSTTTPTARARNEVMTPIALQHDRALSAATSPSTTRAGTAVPQRLPGLDAALVQRGAGIAARSARHRAACRRAQLPRTERRRHAARRAALAGQGPATSNCSCASGTRAFGATIRSA
jgi:hypothetical protein